MHTLCIIFIQIRSNLKSYTIHEHIIIKQSINSITTNQLFTKLQLIYPFISCGYILSAYSTTCIFPIYIETIFFPHHRFWYVHCSMYTSWTGIWNSFSCFHYFSLQNRLSIHKVPFSIYIGYASTPHQTLLSP